jgi:Reverse transcriptase (RNA-dependent DNA polymerase)
VESQVEHTGGKQEHGIKYWDTYAPMALWAFIRMILIIEVLQKWKSKQLDFVLAFPQAPVETDLYMAIPPGFSISGNKRDKVLKLKNNLYDQKQYGQVWNWFLSEGLIQLGFKQSMHDPCIFWRDKTIIVIYSDTRITGPNKQLIDEVITDIGSRFEITHKNTFDDFLGVKLIQNEAEGTIEFIQPQLIDSILNDLNLDDQSNQRKLPASAIKILHRHKSSDKHTEEWHYRSVIGKIYYLEKASRPDLAYAVHQCARFSEDPKIEHTKAVKLIGRY